MRRLLKILLLGTIALLGACGQRGALYFPEKAESILTEQESTN